MELEADAAAAVVGVEAEAEVLLECTGLSAGVEATMRIQIAGVVHVCCGTARFNKYYNICREKIPKDI